MKEVFSLDNGVKVIGADGEYLAFYNNRIIARNKVLVPVLKDLRKLNLISPDEYIFRRKNIEKDNK